MKLLSISGVVGSEPVIKMTKSNIPLIEFRMVNNDDKKNPFWLTVRSMQSNVVNFAKKYVNKGSQVLVCGAYEDDMYTNNQQQVLISRNVWAVEINPLRTYNTSEQKSNEDEGSDMDGMTSEGAPLEGGNPNPEPQPEPESKPETVPVEDVPADDLPF
jgi:single-stranded DNA-binding protein